MPLKLVKRHGQRSWYIRGTERGTSLDESTLTDNREAAEAILLKRRAEILNASIFGPKASVTFVQAAVSYLEQGGEGRFLEPLLEHFKGRKLHSIRQQDIDAAARALHPGCAASTVNRQVYTPMSAVLRHAAQRDWYDMRPLKRPKQIDALPRWIQPEEAERLIEHCSPHMKLLVLFLFSTGCRLSEALYLQWADVDLKGGQVWFSKTKNGDARGVTLKARLRTGIDALPHRVGAVFLTNNGKPYKRVENCGGQIKTGFNAACRRAGIEDFTPHCCRHSFATWHYAKHRDLAALMQICGWKDVTMAMRYTHVNVRHLAESMEAVGI